MSLMGSERMRRLAILTALAVGLGLLVASVVLRAPLAGVIGIAALVFTALAMLLGIRLRANTLLEGVLAIQESMKRMGETQGRMRESQKRLHDRVAWLNRARLNDQAQGADAIARLDGELRKLNEFALGGQSAMDVLYRAQEESRTTIDDIQDLVFRSFRESVESINELRAQQADVNGVARADLDRLIALTSSMSAAQQAYGDHLNQVDGALAALATTAERQVGTSRAITTKVDALMADSASAGEWRSSVDGSLQTLVASAGQDAEAARVLRGKVDALVTDLESAGEWRSSVDGVLEILGTSVGQSVEAAGSLRDKVDALDEKAAPLAGIASDLHRVQERVSSFGSTLQKMEYEMVQEIEALLHLQRMFDITQPTPLLGGWAMDPLGVLGLVRCVLEEKPANTLECGSGSSTIWTALAMKRNGSGKIISLEHDEKYAAATNDAIRALGLEDVAEVRLAPLRELSFDGASYDWYDTAGFDDLADIDLLVVDGPPGTTGKMARYPALPVLAQHLVPGALVVLDDAKRQDEREILKSWQEKWSQLGDQHVIAPRTVGLRWGAAVASAGTKS